MSPAMRYGRRMLTVLLGLATLGAPRGAEVVLVKDATLWTSSEKGILEGGDLLIRDGIVAGVAADIAPPPDARIVEAAGKHVTAGIIDAHSHTAIQGGVNEGSNNVTAEVRIGDVIDPTDISIYRQLAGGVTAANLLHGSANAIGGQNQVIKLRWGADAEGLKLAGAPPGIKFALGENPKRSNFQSPSEPRYPATRMGVEQSIRERFLAAERYEKDWEEYNGLSARRQARRIPPRHDLQLEAIAEILRGERLVHSHCYRQDEILMLIRLAEEFGFRIASFQHVLEGYKIADEIAGHGAGASTFSDWWAYKLEAYDAIPFNGALMAERGVVVSFNSDSSELARRLNLEAAKGVKYGGMTEPEALKLVTLNPAIQLGIRDRVGSLEPGKDADFVIWSGHPFSVYTIAEQTWVDGIKTFDREEDLARRAEIAERRAALIDKVRKGDKAGEQSGDTGKEEEEPASEPDAGEAPPDRPVTYTDRVGAQGGTLAIVGAAVHTVSGPVIEEGTVVIQDGLIAEVGQRVAVPDGATVVSAGGLHLYPGMIDADTVVGLTEIGSVRGSVDIAETGKINPNVRVEVAINPESELIPVTRANGITHVLTAPQGGVISGTSALIRLDGWTWEEVTAAAPVAMHINYPAYPTEPSEFSFGPPKSEEDQLKERKEDLESLESAFESARAYRHAMNAGSAGLRPDPVLEALLPVLDGRIPVIISASEVRQIKEAAQWAKKEGLRMILRTASGVWHVTDLLAKNDIPVIFGPVLGMSFREDEPYDTAYTAPLKLHEAGVRFCIISSGSSFGASSTRNLPYHAGMAAAFGLPKDVALKAVTLYPAEILGVAGKLGSIEKGKSASLILTDGDPLEIRTNVIREFIDGREVDSSNRHRRLYEKYRSRPAPTVAGR